MVVEKLRWTGLRDDRAASRIVIQAQDQRAHRRASGANRRVGGGIPESVKLQRPFLLGEHAVLPKLTFDVPGAMCSQGHYALRREMLAFTGVLYIDAKISETTTGWRSLLLKVVDPFFRKNGQRSCRSPFA